MTLEEGDSISIAYYQQSLDQFESAGEYRVNKTDTENSTITVPIINSATNGFTALFFVIKTQQDKLINIHEIGIDGATVLPAGKISDDSILWQGSIDLTFNSANSSYTGFINKDIPGYFALDIESFYYNHLYIFIPLILFLVLSIALLLFSLKAGNNRLLLCSLCLYVLCLPLKISWGNWALVLLALICIITFIRKKSYRLNLNIASYCILGIALAYAISEFYAIDPINSWKNIRLILTPVAYVFIFSVISPKRKDITITLRFFIRFVALYSAYSIICYIIASPISGVDSLREAFVNAKIFRVFLFAYPSYTHPSFLTIIITMAIPIAIYLKKENAIGLAELIVTIALISIVAALSGARVGLIIIPLLLVSGFLYYINIPKYIKLFVIVGICVFAVLVANISPLRNVLNDPLRRKMRKTAIAAIKEKPAFGWGANSMEYLLQDKDIAQKAGLVEPYGTHKHFHNQYLDMLAQLGFIGSLPFFILFAYLLFIAIKRKDFPLLAYLTIYLLFMYVESVDAAAKGIQPLAFWLCFLSSTQKTRLRKRSSSLFRSEE
ncbi:MAG: O-antigen ligase family protein [Prevotellaceae bacterium]|jgi:O-antigen ligase|nr:O-antigen ligase family protein [Prevotellaceae bacterium]